MTNNNTYISKNVIEKGAYVSKNFLNELEIESIKQLLKNFKKEKKDSTRFFPIDKTSLLIKLLKCDLSSFKQGLYFKKLALKLDLQKISTDILGEESKLVAIDAYYSKKSSQNVIDWHCDFAYSGNPNPKKILDHKNKSIKYFVYLTDTHYKNGSLAYIPYSHIIQRTYSQFLLEKKIDYKPFWKLKDFRNQIISDPLKSMIKNEVGSKVFENFINETNFIDENNGDIKKYDYDLKSGDALIFDELGFHRGSAPTLNDRLVIRFFYSRKNRKVS